MKQIPAILPALCLAACMLFNTGCASGDEARVTLKLQRNDLAQAGIKAEREVRLIDKILNFFSTPAYAGSTWEATKGTLALEIEHPALGKITVPLATGATEYTTVLPVAKGVKFTIRSAIENDGYGNIYSNWGGQVTADLQTTDDNVLTVIMLPIVPIWNFSGTNASVCSYTPVSNISNPAIELWRSETPTGEYIKINSISASTAVYSIPDNSGASGTYYYKTRFVGTVAGVQAEGVLSDYSEGNLMY